MSRTHPSDMQRAELAFGCSVCPAGPGDWCVAASGAYTDNLHSNRFEQCQEILELTGWMAEEEAQRRLIITLRQGIREIRDTGGRDVRDKCDRLLARY